MGDRLDDVSGAIWGMSTPISQWRFPFPTQPAGTRVTTQPILVMMVYRGGERFQRALTSLLDSQQFFKRIVVSVTAPETSDDVLIAERFRDESLNRMELICTGAELPTMRHQAFWIDYLESTGAKPSDWIYWLAYDDQVRAKGVERLVDDYGNWPLEPGTAYFGPWAMRHERADEVLQGSGAGPLESWTSFPIEGPLKLPVMSWVRNQLAQPTYMQMSGSVCTFESHQRLITSRPSKTGPMRIEMATAAAAGNRFVEEFAEPVSVIYGRPNSDRASYGKAARKEDLHLLVWLARYTARHPSAAPQIALIAIETIKAYAGLIMRKRPLPEEEWRVRSLLAQE